MELHARNLRQIKRTEPGRVASPACEHRGTRYCLFLLSPYPHSLPIRRLWGACSGLSLHLVFKEGRQDGMSEPRPLQGADRIMGSSPGQTRMAQGQQLRIDSCRALGALAVCWRMGCSGPRQNIVVESIEEQVQDNHEGLFGDGSEHPGRNRQ